MAENATPVNASEPRDALTKAVEFLEAGAWQQAHAVSVEVIRLSKSSWKPYAAALFGQLQRSSLSVQLNIAEGYTFGDSPTFTRHLGIAYGSAVETGELLRLAVEAEVKEEKLLKPLLQRTQETEHILLGLLKRRRRFKP